MANELPTADRLVIDQKLHEKGLALFYAKGVRAVSLDDLCNEVGITPEIFRSFYESKHDLFLSIAEKSQCEKFETILEFSKTYEGKADDFVGEFFDRVCQFIIDCPTMEILSRPQEFETFIQKVPPARWKKYQDFQKSEYCNALAIAGKERRLFGKIDGDIIVGLISLSMQIVSRQHILVEAQFKKYTDLLRDLFVFKLARQQAMTWL